MILAALPLKSRERPGGATSGAAFDLFHDAHKTSAPTMTKQAALSNYRAQTAYLNRSITELEGTASAPAKAPAKRKTEAIAKQVAAKGKTKKTAAA